MSEIYNWNPWVGCSMISDGCKHCYVYEKSFGFNTTKFCNIKFNKKDFYKIVGKTRKYDDDLQKYVMKYKIPSGSVIKICDESDFFIEEADYFRKRAWKLISERMDCVFIIETKRVNRVEKCLPDTWSSEGWPNVKLYISIENQAEANNRLKYIKDLKFKHIGIKISPILESIKITEALATNKVEDVIVCGESSNMYNVRQTNYSDVLNIREQCIRYDINFLFEKTGSALNKGESIIKIKDHSEKDMADYYDLNIISYNSDVKTTAEEIEVQRRIEEAAEIHKLVKSLYDKSE